MTYMRCAAKSWHQPGNNRASPVCSQHLTNLSLCVEANVTNRIIRCWCLPRCNPSLEAATHLPMSPPLLYVHNVLPLI